MIINILCWLGFHDWGSNGFSNTRQCWHCSKNEGISPHPKPEEVGEE